MRRRKRRIPGEKMTDLRAAVFKLRGGLWTVLFLTVWFLAGKAGASAIAVGICLVALGQGIRFWASGCITRYRGEKIGAENLVTWGPYAFVRNPLYLGNGLIGAGWGILAGWKALCVFLGAFVVLYGIFIVPCEEEFLEKKFGEEYRNYKRKTGRFLPVWRPAMEVDGPFDVSILWKSERHSLFITLAGTAVLIASVW